MVDLSTVSPAIALGPLDGRYRAVAAPLVNHLSEAALNRARLAVEVEWLIHLTDHHVLPGAPRLSESEKAYLRGTVDSFGAAEIAELAEVEAVTRHDVKAVEYLLKRRLDAAGDDPSVPGADGGPTVLPTVHEIVHIFCTSEDINNLAYALTVRSAVKEAWLPAAHGLIADLTAMAREHAGAAMLARTHGQPATPTTLGKELAVLARRLTRQVRRVESAEYLGKFNGATGTYGAHVVAVPEADWQSVSRTFVEGLGLVWNPLTTQIESHDWQAELYCDIARFNRVAHNLATDVWSYISLGYFRQRLAAQGSTGSSTMPHKVNPIRFENGEANLEISCSLLETLAATLVTSRLQRDLTDSTTQRNIGTALGHSLLAIDNIRRGLAGLDVDAARLEADLDATWEVLGEPVQQAMRAASVAGATGMADPYERLKKLTRGKRVTPEAMRAFISGLGMPDDVEARLLALTPATYTGLAARLVEHLDD
ncbi:adenylosuccinate lyase [uncultured Actinomyces sp.]|uniref:adenylosuccinate lyase n=1 Tax=uncultured Actinomyces sp. TaxID=249061 RepID=UPI0028D598CF|nr:adenylosuccinate lyase [uncultured Actinomyces sp.]